MRVALLVYLFILAGNLFAQQILIETDEDIRMMALNEEGRLHIITSEYLCQFEGIVQVGDCLPAGEPGTKIITGKDDHFHLLSGTSLRYYQYNELIHQVEAPDIVSNGVSMGSQLVIATASGLYLFSSDSLQYKKSIIENEFINDVCVINESLAAIALDDGVAIIDTNGVIKKRLTGQPIVNRILASDNRLFGLTESNIVLTWDIELNLLDEHEISSGEVREINLVWGDICLLLDNGLYMLTDSQEVLVTTGVFETMLSTETMVLLAETNHVVGVNMTGWPVQSENQNFSVAINPVGGYWVGRNKQIVRIAEGLERNTIELPTQSNNLFVSSIAVDTEHIYAGTMGEGLYVFDHQGRQVKHFFIEDANNINNVIQLKLIGETLWVSYLNGIKLINTQTMQIDEQLDDFISETYLYCIEPIDKSNIYLGTSESGLLHYRQHETDTLLKGKSVYSLCRSGDTLFAGTAEGEVFLLENDRTKLVYDGEKIYSLAAVGNMLVINDRNRTLLLHLGTNRVFPVDNTSMGNCQLNGISTHSDRWVVAYENGLLLLNKKGLNALLNLRLHLNAPVMFNQVLEKDINDFNHTQNAITFSYHLNNYYRNRNIYYKYRLIGLDTTWLSTEQSKIDYYNLSPGKYQFEVAFGYTPDFPVFSPQTYSFTIRPPFWLTWWFLSLAAIALLSTSFMLLKLREKRLISKQTALREKLSFQLDRLRSQIDPHFLFNSFNSLIGLMEEDSQKAIKATEELSGLYRNILDFQQQDLIHLTEELDLAKRYFSMHQLRYENLITLDVAVDDCTGMLLPMSVQFLIENAIKHNVIQEGRVLSIRIIREGDYILVTNNRNPRPGPVKSAGYGLQNLAKRYALITEKKVEIQKNPEYFTVKLPVIP